MAIVRTTPKETNTSGAAPPTGAGVDRTKSVVAQQAQATAQRAAASRAITPARGQAPARSVDTKSFVSDTITELRRVVWPSRDDVRSGTIVTIGLLIFFGAYIFVLDYGVNALFHALGLYPPTTP